MNAYPVIQKQLFMSNMGGWVCPFSESHGWDAGMGTILAPWGEEFMDSGLTRSHDTLLASWCFSLTSMGPSLHYSPDWPTGPRLSLAPVHLALCPAPSPCLLRITAHLYFSHPVKLMTYVFFPCFGCLPDSLHISPSLPKWHTTLDDCLLSGALLWVPDS